MAAKNLVKLAKSTNKNNATVQEKKTVTPTEKKPSNPKEERDLKAKQRVDDLLKDVPLTINELNSKNDNSGLSGSSNKTPELTSEWLEEQVGLLSTDVETLRSELGKAKADYKKIFDENQQLRGGANVNDSVIKSKIVELFNELQGNYMSMGKNPINGAPNFIISPAAFMNRMILFFPFLQGEKKFM